MITQIDWRIKMRKRIEQGAWEPAPWTTQPWAQDFTDHFAHISREDQSQIAYFPSEVYGLRGIPLRMKPGKYLQKYYGSKLTAEQIQLWAAKLRAKDLGLRFARTAKEIENVYKGTGHGTQACMSHGKDHFHATRSVNIHPTAVYAGALEVAFLEQQGAQLARTLVWPERKIFSRLYGDTRALQAALEAAGYHQDLLTGAPLIGVSLNKYMAESEGYETGDTPENIFLACPYVDHIKWARYDPTSKQLILQHFAKGATHSVQHGNGVAYPIKLAPPRPNSQALYPAIDWAVCFAAEEGKPLTPEDRKKLEDEFMATRKKKSIYDRVLRPLTAAPFHTQFIHVNLGDMFRPETMQPQQRPRDQFEHYVEQTMSTPLAGPFPRVFHISIHSLNYFTERAVGGVLTFGRTTPTPQRIAITEIREHDGHYRVSFDLAPVQEPHP